MDGIRSKVAHLRLVLNRADDRKDLIAQVNGFFDDAVAQLQSRRRELLRDIERHSVSNADKLVEVADDFDGLPASLAVAELRDAEQKLDACLSRESEWLQRGQFDSGLAEKRVSRLMDCLRVAWRDEWLMRREADNPFAEAADTAAAAAAVEEADAGSDDDCGDGAYSAYKLLPQAGLNFDSVLRGGGGDCDGDKKQFSRSPASSSGSSSRGRKSEAPQPLRGGGKQFQKPVGQLAPQTRPAKSAGDAFPPPPPPLPSNRPASLAANPGAAFDTRGVPTSVAFLHGSFYVLERDHQHQLTLQSPPDSKGGLVRVYDRRGRFKHPLPVRADPGGGGGAARMHRIRVCHQRAWLLLIDRSAGRVHCVRTNGSVEATYGPAITNRFSLNKPEDAVCTGDLLFICCPTVGIFIVSLQQQPTTADADSDGGVGGGGGGDSDGGGFRVTQSNASLGLNQPVRMSWNYAERWLVVIDREADGGGRYSVHRFKFERAGISSRLVRHCSGQLVLLDAPDDWPPVALTYRGNLMLALRDAAGVGRIMRLPAGRVFDQSPGDDQHGLLRWVCQAEGKGWALSDACYMNTQEFAVADSVGICVLSH